MKIGKTTPAPNKAPLREQKKVVRVRPVPVRIPKKTEKKDNVPV